MATVPHPGTFLRERFLEPKNLNPAQLAKAINVPVTRVHEILHGRRRITAQTALRLSYYFGGSSEAWLRLQTAYDLAQVRNRAQIEAEVIPLAAA